MRTNLELPDPLFARLKARAATEGVTVKELLRSFVEQGLQSPTTSAGLPRSAATLPQRHGQRAIDENQLSNAGLFDLIEL